MAWQDELRPASFRGVPFGVLGGSVRFGRRNAVHEYPNRDVVWVEDLGRAARRITLTGFLVENSLMYGGAGVIGQRERLIAACEAQGDGELVHPTLGRLTVSLMDTETIESWDKGRVFEVYFAFVEAGQRVFPAATASTVADVQAAASGLDAAAALSFIVRVRSALQLGAAIVARAQRTAAAWVNRATQLVNDATNLYNLVGSLSGSYGRFLGGKQSGYIASKANSASLVTVASLIASGSASRVMVRDAGASLQTSAQGLDVSSSATFAQAAQAVAAALLKATTNPDDAIRILANLSTFVASDPTTSSQTGAGIATMQQASSDLFRRACLAARARASSLYQPWSYDDAVSLRQSLADALDAEILLAGDQAEDGVFIALRRLRAAVIADLTARGADLATLKTVTVNASLPATVLAQRLYKDPSRADELIFEANPIHPAFMPATFQALAQ